MKYACYMVENGNEHEMFVADDLYKAFQQVWKKGKTYRTKSDAIDKLLGASKEECSEALKRLVPVAKKSW